MRQPPTKRVRSRRNTLENQWRSFTQLQCDLHKNEWQILSNLLAKKGIQNLATTASIFLQKIQLFRGFHICQLLHKARHKMLMLHAVFQSQKGGLKINVARKVHVNQSCNKDHIFISAHVSHRRKNSSVLCTSQ